MHIKANTTTSYVFLLHAHPLAVATSYCNTWCTHAATHAACCISDVLQLYSAQQATVTYFPGLACDMCSALFVMACCQICWLSLTLSVWLGGEATFTSCPAACCRKAPTAGLKSSTSTLSTIRQWPSPSNAASPSKTVGCTTSGLSTVMRICQQPQWQDKPSGRIPGATCLA